MKNTWARNPTFILFNKLKLGWLINGKAAKHAKHTQENQKHWTTGWKETSIPNTHDTGQHNAQVSKHTRHTIPMSQCSQTGLFKCTIQTQSVSSADIAFFSVTTHASPSDFSSTLVQNSGTPILRNYCILNITHANPYLPGRHSWPPSQHTQDRFLPSPRRRPSPVVPKMVASSLLPSTISPPPLSRTCRRLSRVWPSSPLSSCSPTQGTGPIRPTWKIEGGGHIVPWIGLLLIL